MRIENLCPWTDCKTNRVEWHASSMQDPSTGLWTYSPTESNDSCTVALFSPGTGLTLGDYVAVVEADTLENAYISVSNGSTVNYTELSRTTNRLVTRVKRDYESNILLWIKGANSHVTPARAALYTLGDWNALQKLGRTIITSTDYALFKQ
ncbi:hypothetical protein [Bifidobacterium biavatii]|uniref:Uncharacterized protein n=1 Tax=Bifidobacterium biavatii DSM 23969 TaxID=1437608 RepID=A0A086ZU00_9BIFI|nr:hypothetical protein [Bifidobacterium biavatii]KFI50000.1 hypothetical protein BBIA_2133 [Bifidobacterium biavatii DSM 23969]